MADEKKLVPITSLDKAGIIKDSSPHILPPNAFSDGKNIRFKDNAIYKRKGTVKALSDVGATTANVTNANRGSGANTATFTFDVEPGLSVGASFTISGVTASVDPTDFNGTFTVHSISEDFLTYTVTQDISSASDTGNYTSGGTYSFTGSIDFFDYWPAPNNPQYIEVQKNTDASPAVPAFYSIRSSGTRERIEFARFNIESITQAANSVVVVDGNLYLENNDDFRVYSSDPSGYDGTYVVSSVSYSSSTNKTTLTTTKDNSSVGSNYTADSGYAVPSDSVKPSEYPSGLDLNWQSTLFTGGYAYVLNDGYHTPQYALGSLGSSYTVPTFRDLPGWDFKKQSDNVHLSCKVIRGYESRLIAGNINEYAISSGVVATSPSKSFPGTIHVSTAAAAGDIPETWDTNVTGSDAVQFELSTTSEIQEIMPLQGTAIIYTTDSIHSLRFDARGNPSQQTVAEGYGAIDTGAVLEYDGKHFVIGSDDIYLFGGHPGSIQSVANDRVREYFYENLNPLSANRKNLFLIRDQSLDEIHIYFPNKMSTDGTCNEFLAWNYRNNTWTINDCDNLVSGVFAPVRGGGVAGGTVSFSGITNTAAAAQAEVQQLTVNLTSNYPTTGVDEVQEIDYSGSTTTAASTYDAEAVAAVIDDSIIPYNEEHVDIVFNSAFESASTLAVSETSNSSQTNIDGTDIDVTISASAGAKNNSVATLTTAVNSNSYPTGSFSPGSGTEYFWGGSTTANTALAVLKAQKQNSGSSEQSYPAYPSGYSEAGDPGISLRIDHNNFRNYVDTSELPAAGILGPYRFFTPVLEKVYDSSGNDITSTFSLSGGETLSNNNYVANFTLHTCTSSSFDYSNIKYIEIKFTQYGNYTAPEGTLNTPVRIAYRVNTYNASTQYQYKYSISVKGGSTTYYATSGINKYASLTVTNRIQDYTLSGLTGSDSITFSTDNFGVAAADLSRTTNGTLRVVSLSSTNTNYTLSGTAGAVNSSGTHNGSSFGNIVENIAAGIDLVSENASLSSRTQSVTLAATSRGSSGTSYQKSSSGYGFFSNSKENGELLGGVEEFGFKLPGSDLPAGQYNISHAGTFGFTVNAYYDHNGTSDISYRYDNIKFTSIPTTITITGKDNTKVKGFVRTLTKGSSSSSISFVEGGETMQSRAYPITLSSVNGIKYKVTNTGSTTYVPDILMTVGGITNSTSSLAASASLEVSLYGTAVSRTYEVTLGTITDFQLSGSQGFPTINYAFHKGDTATAAASYMVDTINSTTDAKVRASIKGSTGTDARTVRVYYANSNASSASIAFAGTTDTTGSTSAQTADYTVSTIDSHRSTYSSYRIRINDSLGNEVIDITRAASSARTTPTQLGEYLRDEIITAVNASAVLSEGEVWFDGGSGLDSENNYFIYISVPSQEDYTITIVDATSVVNGNVAGFYNDIPVGTVLSANSGDTPDSVILKDPYNTTLFSFNLGSGETIDQVMTRIKDLIQDEATDGWSASINTTTDVLTLTATQPGTTPVQSGGAADSTHTGSGVFRFEYTVSTNANTAGDLPSSLNASITTLGSNPSVELTLYDPWRGANQTFLAGGSTNSDIAEAIAVEINRFWPNWTATFSSAVVTITAKDKDWVLSDRTGIVSNDVVFASRAIYVSEVAYPAGTVGATGNAATGTFTASSQSSNFTVAQSTIGHPIINESVLTLAVGYSNGTTVTENIQFSDASDATAMATSFNSTINSASIEAFEASRDGTTVTISITDFTVGVDSITLTFDEQTESGNRNTVSRTNGNNLGTGGSTQAEPLGTTTGLKTTTNAERPYANTEFDLTRLHPVVASSSKIFAEGFGFTKGADPTANPVVAGTPYTSYVERQQLAVDNSVEYKKDISYIQLLLETGNVSVKMKGADAPGATIDLSSADRKTFDYDSDYKVDFRENGRVIAYRIEDENPGTSVTGWKISGIGFKVETTESRGKR